MTKNKLMTYTFVALLILTIVSAVLWFPVNVPHADGTTGWNLGLTLILCALVSVAVAVGVDALFYKLVSDSPLNLMSAAVFGLIVTDSYTLGAPLMNTEGILPVEAPGAFVYVALISLIGMAVFKKVMSIAGRKYVNPAAAAKFIVFLPFINSVLIAVDHLKISMSGYLLEIPRLAGPIGLTAPGGGNSFGTYMQSCFSNPLSTAPPDVSWIMLFEKFHGWAGGACSIAVIVVGIGFFVVARRYVKWRITLAYLVTTAIMSVLFSLAYADVDFMARLLFELFIGSSIFMAFFMATDPATTPLTYTGQAIFGVGLGVLTILIQTFMNFFGGSILALIIMNLAAPALDKVGKLKPSTETKEPKLPKAQSFAPEKVKEFQCIRCGACMRVCCHKLSPILIKQAFDKMDFDTLSKLHADYCTGCGHCTFVCPARIDLRKSILQAKGMLRQQ